jgi:hypothetical protein
MRTERFRVWAATSTAKPTCLSLKTSPQMCHLHAGFRKEQSRIVGNFFYRGSHLYFTCLELKLQLNVNNLNSHCVLFSLVNVIN